MSLVVVVLSTRARYTNPQPKYPFTEGRNRELYLS